MDRNKIVLQSERMQFRKITPDDFDELSKMLTNSKVMYAWEHIFTKEQIDEWIERQIKYYHDDGVGYFAAISKENGEFLGQMGLHWSNINDKHILEVCYMLKEKHWHKGYAQEGIDALLNYAHTTMNENKVYATIRTNNLPSIAVAEKAEMSQIGSFIKRYNNIDMEHYIYLKDFNAH